MKSTTKSKLSRSRRDRHASSDDSNDSKKDSSFPSSSSGESLSSSNVSSEGEGYEALRKGVYAMRKEVRKLRRKGQAKSKKGKTNCSDPGSSGDSSSSEGKKEGRVKVRKVKKPSMSHKIKSERAKDWDSDSDDGIVHGKTGPRRKARAKERTKEAKQAKKNKKKKGTKAEFIRVDHLWDEDKHRFVLKKSSEHVEAGEYEQYAFNVRRSFDWENKYTDTCLDIISEPLKAALRHIVGEAKGISLEEDSPCVDPNTIFLFLEELRAYMDDLRAQNISKMRGGKARMVVLQASHLKVLIKYLDRDYDKIKKSLYPLLKSRKITFDLLWALFKSNEIIYAPTYATEEEPRAFKVDYANLVSKETYRYYLQVWPTHLR